MNKEKEEVKKSHSMKVQVAERILENEVYDKEENWGVRFRTFHALDDFGFEIGRVTCAFKPVEEIGIQNGIYNSAFAFCSPNDLYSKKVGQALAFGRLASPRGTNRFPQVSSKGFGCKSR
jgi:hypothetical protein